MKKKSRYQLFSLLCFHTISICILVQLLVEYSKYSKSTTFRGATLIRGKRLFQCRYPKVQHLFQTWCLLEEIQYSVHLPNEGLQIFKYQLCQGCFCRNFLKTLRTAFSKNTAGRVFLISRTTFNPLTPGGNKRSYILKQTQQASLYCFRKIYKM